MEFIAAIITFIAGYLGATMGAVMNWPDAGAIVAITVMGFFILKRIEKRRVKKLQRSLCSFFVRSRFYFSR